MRNANQLATLLRSKVKLGKTGTMEYAELKRRIGEEFNGMRLHEFYFENLTKRSVPLKKQSPLYGKLGGTSGSLVPGSVASWGVGGMRGVGWVILAFDVQTGRLFNAWLGEHDTGLLVDTRPLLVMDMFEHAFLLDHGLKRKDYEEAFFNMIDWDRVKKRLEVCLKDQPVVVGEEVAERG